MERQPYTLKEIARIFVPNQILQRMSEELAERFGTQDNLLNTFRIQGNDRRCGSVEIQKTGLNSLADMRDRVSRFYQGEGYTISNDEPLIVEIGEVFFQVDIEEAPHSFVIMVSKQTT